MKSFHVASIMSRSASYFLRIEHSTASLTSCGALTLNPRATALMSSEYNALNFAPTENLNHAAALWRAAPQEVKMDVLRGAESDWPTLAMLGEVADLFTNPVVLTAAVVEKWEEFNA